MIITIILIVLWNQNRLLSEIIRLPIGICAAVIASFSFLLICSEVSIESKVARWVGSYSLEIYLYHNLFRHLYKDVFIISNDALYFSCVIVSTILISVTMHKDASVILNTTVHEKGNVASS